MEAEDLEARVAALERLVATLSEDREAAPGGDLGGRLAQLESRLAVQESRLEKAASGIANRADQAGGEATLELGGPEDAPSTDPPPDVDTRICKGTGGPTGREDRSVDYASGVANVLNLHGFDKPSALVYEGPDPDSDDDPTQFAGRVPKDGDISAGGELKWFTLKPVPRLDTDETGEITTPGQSIDKATVARAGGKTTKVLQLRQFANTSDTQSAQAMGATGDLPTVENLQICMRLVKAGERPKLVYVPAASGLFWLRGANQFSNFGTGVRIGDPTNGYVTITAS